jgi:hypothetical protein
MNHIFTNLYSISKMLIGESSYYETVIKQAVKTRWNWQHSMMVVPVLFSTEHKHLLNHTKFLLKYEYLSINPIFTKITTALRTAVANEYSLDKEATSYDDCLDALLLSLRHYFSASVRINL